MSCVLGVGVRVFVFRLPHVRFFLFLLRWAVTDRAGCPDSSTAARTRSTSAAGVSLSSSAELGSAASPWVSSTWRRDSANRCVRACDAYILFGA